MIVISFFINNHCNRRILPIAILAKISRDRGLAMDDCRNCERILYVNDSDSIK